MNDKYSLGSINNNFKIIGLIFITCILVIAILYYFRNSINKHKLIEKFFSNDIKAIINTSSNYASSTQPDDDQIVKDNDKYNGEFKLRNCQVYFVGEDEKEACDSLYNNDPLRTNCKYEFKDDWKEIDTISYDNQVNTITNKIYNKAYNNKEHIENHNYMTACFKNIDTSDNSFKYKDNSFIVHKNIGTRDDETAFNNTLRLNTEGGSSGKYISKVFNDSTNFMENNNNLLDSICSIKYDNFPNLKTTYYKFKLININNEWLLDDLKDVVLNEDQTSFSEEKPSSFTGDAAFGIFVNSYSEGIVRFSVFKSSNIPEKNVEVYRFKYNYLCDGQILEYRNNINTSMKIKEIFDNTDISEISNHTFDLEFAEEQIFLDFWNNNNYKSMYYENKSDDIRLGLDTTLRTTAINLHSSPFDALLAIEDNIITTNDGLIEQAEAEKTTFHTKYNINGSTEDSIVKEPIIGLPTKNIAIFNYTKGYNIVVTDKKTSEPVGRFGGAEPNVESDERMYPPVRNIEKQNHSINGQAYGNGTYVISYNNIYSGSSQPFHIFNDNNGSESGHWAIHRYRDGNGNGQYTQNDHIVSGYNGDWVKIKFPVAINLTGYGFKIRPDFLSRAPGNFKIYGSNNETTWVELTTGTNISYVKDLYITSVSTSNHYTSFALVVNKLTGIGGGSYVLNFDQWYIFGKEALQPIKIDDDYKYFSFKNKKSRGSSLIYDFRPYNDLASWSNYAKSLGGHVVANSFNADGIWFNNDHIGYLEFPLPDGYNFVEVHYYNGHPGGNVNLLIGGVIVSSVSSHNTITRYFGSYRQGQIFRIDERNTAIIGKNLIIKVSRSEDNQATGGGYSKYRFRIIERRSAGHSETQFSEIGFYTANGTKMNPVSVKTSHNTHPGHENAAMSADNNAGSKYFGGGHGDIWLEYIFSSSFKLNYYDWTTANDSTHRDPVHWVMETLEEGRWVIINEINYRHNTNLVTHSRFAKVGPFHIKSTTTITELQTINFPEETECDILIVGGGGSGGDGGGGAGQFKYLQNQKLNGQYTINVGAGGIGSTGFRTQGRNGITSSIVGNFKNTKIIAFGGGGGAGYNTSRTPIYNERLGSGGGGSFDANGMIFSMLEYTNTLNGFKGSVTNLNSYGTAGGGGGAGGNAPNIYFTNDSPDNSGRGNIQIAHGGIGLQSNITGTNKYYAGGGAGGVNTNNTRSNSSVTPKGGLGGGGNGSISHLGRGTPGEPNTGGGGGGCDPENLIGGLDGGSGIVIIRYRVSLSNEELIRRSSVLDTNAINYMSQSLTYFGNDANIKENTIWRNTSTDTTTIKAYILRTITIMSYMFLQSATTYNFVTTLGIKSESIIYMNTMFVMGDNINIIKNGQNNFTTKDIIGGGFYIFSYTCEILLNTDQVIKFGINDTISDTNILDYLYAGSKLYNEKVLINSGSINNKFVNILFKNNTEHSMRIISDYLDESHDHYKIDIYEDEIQKARNRKTIINTNKTVKLQNTNALIDNFLLKLSSIDYTDPKWFTTTPPTLKLNPNPSDIFTNYKETDYVTYEKIEKINDRTPTVSLGDVGRNPSTNFATPNYINRSIYVLRS